MMLSEFKAIIEHQDTKIVEKVWGREVHLVNAEYCAKILVLNEDYCCSLHYHRKKKETFLVLSGHVQLEVAEGSYILLPGERYTIDPGVEHRFTGLTEALILEVSTHDEASDSYRLEPSKKLES